MTDYPQSYDYPHVQSRRLACGALIIFLLLTCVSDISGLGVRLTIRRVHLTGPDMCVCVRAHVTLPPNDKRLAEGCVWMWGGWTTRVRNGPKLVALASSAKIVERTQTLANYDAHMPNTCI